MESFGLFLGNQETDFIYRTDSHSKRQLANLNAINGIKHVSVRNMNNNQS